MSFRQMETEAMTGHTARIDHTGQALGDGWQTAKAAVGEAAGGIGQDPLGAAFAAGYLPASDSFQQAADTVPPRFAGLADGGRRSVGEYLGSEADAVARLNSLLPQGISHDSAP